EENLPADYVLTARQRRRQETLRTCQLIARSFPGWTEAFCELSLRRFYTYGIAFWKECFPSSQVMVALSDGKMDAEAQRDIFFAEMLVMNQLIWGLKDAGVADNDSSLHQRNRLDKSSY